MKLIIDIPDHIYSMVTNTGTFGCYRFNTSKAIRQGIPLKDEVMIATLMSLVTDKDYKPNLEGENSWTHKEI